MLNEDLAERIHRFWFGEIGKNGLCKPEVSARWFEKDETFDRLIESEFGAVLNSAGTDSASQMKATPRSVLSYIILTDQFPRNIHRERPESFAFDRLALTACREGMEKGLDTSLLPVERTFFYMPLMHSENFAIQKLSVEIYSSLASEFRRIPEIFENLSCSADYARRHFEIIERFGRYPHRNKILGRESTTGEIEFLKQPGSGF